MFKFSASDINVLILVLQPVRITNQVAAVAAVLAVAVVAVVAAAVAVAVFDFAVAAAPAGYNFSNQMSTAVVRPQAAHLVIAQEKIVKIVWRSVTDAAVAAVAAVLLCCCCRCCCCCCCCCSCWL